jgi:hypothetical protein
MKDSKYYQVNCKKISFLLFPFDSSNKKYKILKQLLDESKINIFYGENNDYFDKIYNTILEETGIYLESIEFVDNEEIYAWGTIFKEDDKYFVFKPDNTE